MKVEFKYTASEVLTRAREENFKFMCEYTDKSIGEQLIQFEVIKHLNRMAQERMDADLKE